MNMIKLLIVAVLLSFSVNTLAITEYGYGEVIKVVPIKHEVRTKIPVQTCWDADVIRRSDSAVRSRNIRIITGALLGGVIGNGLGRNSKHREDITITGAVIGGMFGNDRYRTKRHYRSYEYRTIEERCQTTFRYQTQIKTIGYHVTYIYEGQEYNTRTQEHPGSRIRIEVTTTTTITSLE